MKVDANGFMMQRNDAAFERAHELIRLGKVNTDSDWHAVEVPTAEEEDERRHDWFLAVDPNSDEGDTHYALLYGDYEVVHRSALLAAQSIARQRGDDALKEAIDQLIIAIDKRPDAVESASDHSFPASDPPNWRGRR